LMSKEWNGFRKCHSCTDSIFIIQQLAGKEKQYSWGTCLLFVNFRQHLILFSIINCGKLW
jgi:hypothetical protein